jgi:uncharacterized damage-inducible protein DinB
MQTLENFREFLEFDNWANDLILQALKNSAQPNEKAVQIFGHLLLAENEWLLRMTGEHADSTGFDFWSLETVADCEKLFGENRSNYENLFARLTEEKLDSTATYKNSKGLEFTNTRREILSHVFFHSAQHRGQIIQSIRAVGGAPPYIDFIGFLRNKTALNGKS